MAPGAVGSINFHAGQQRFVRRGDRGMQIGRFPFNGNMKGSSAQRILPIRGFDVARHGQAPEIRIISPITGPNKSPTTKNNQLRFTICEANTI